MKKSKYRQLLTFAIFLLQHVCQLNSQNALKLNLIDDAIYASSTKAKIQYKIGNLKKNPIVYDLNLEGFLNNNSNINDRTIAF